MKNKFSIIMAVVIATVMISCSDSQDPVASTVVFDGDITAELDAGGIESLLAQLILNNQNTDLYTYTVNAGTASGTIRDENGEPLFDQFRMTIILDGVITAGDNDIIIDEIYVDFNAVAPGAFYEELPGANQLDLIPSRIKANSTAKFFMGKRYKVNGAMIQGFTYELMITARVSE